jgi:hypothetical protein
MSNKYSISDKKVTTRGGLIPILKHIKRCKIPQVIRSYVKKRPFWSTYTNEDIFISLAMNMFCGKTRLRQIEDMRSKISIIPRLKIASHDTLGRALKSLATKNIIIESIPHRTRQVNETLVNYNTPLNQTLIKSSKRLGLLKPGKSYTMDMDATFVSTRCRDAKRHKKYKKLGFSPMVCMLDNIPVHISLRQGNASAALNLKTDAEICLDLLKQNKIKVGRFRSDGAGYNRDLLTYIDEQNIKYNVRMPFNGNNKGLKNKIENCNNWRDITIETEDMIWECEVGSFPYTMHNTTMKSKVICLKAPDLNTIEKLESEGEKERRLFIEKKMEELNEKGLLDTEKKSHDDAWVNYEGYNYKLIFTNDFDTSEEDLVLEYNKRGGCERTFHYLKDCGWKYPPFSDIAENNVYLIVSALAYNIFLSALMNFNEYVDGLDAKSRLPKFIDLFVEIACEIIDENNFEFYINDRKIDFGKIK